jgi:type II secretory pathway component HofQ
MTGWVSVAAAPTAQTVSATYSSAPIQQVLLDLGHRYGVTIVVDQSVQGRVTVALHAATLDEALAAVLASGDYRYRRESNLIVVSSRGQT